MLRPATPADLPRLRALQTALSDPNPALLRYAVRDAEGASADNSNPSGSGDDPLVLVSIAGTEPVGYALAFPNRGYLAELAVDPEHRREGRGAALVAAVALRVRAAGRGELALTVHEADRSARAFYDALGFEERGRESGFYDDGDALVLARRL